MQYLEINWNEANLCHTEDLLRWYLLDCLHAALFRQQNVFKFVSFSVCVVSNIRIEAVVTGLVGSWAQGRAWFIVAIGSRYRSRLPWLTAGWLIVGLLDQKYVAKTCAWSLLLQHLSASTKINRFHPQKITADIDKTQYDVLQSSAVYKVPTLLVLAFARYTVRTCHHVKHVLVWLTPCCNVQML